MSKEIDQPRNLQSRSLLAGQAAASASEMESALSTAPDTTAAAFFDVDAPAVAYEVRLAPGGHDLVVTDFNMPKASGLDVARAIAQIRPALPVVITTGYISEALRDGAQASSTWPAGCTGASSSRPPTSPKPHGSSSTSGSPGSRIPSTSRRPAPQDSRSSRTTPSRSSR